MNADVVVVGSLNRDLTVVTPHHPAPGETVLGTGHYWDNGGKGANQAVAAARLGANVIMVGRVGDDDTGRALVKSLHAEGIDVDGVEFDQRAPTGLAIVTIDSSAENTIVVSAGANSNLSPDQVRRHAETIRSAAVVLAQMEVPIHSVAAAAELSSGLVCLNPAPAADLPPDLLARVDVLLPNRTELGKLAGTSPPSSPGEVAAAAARLDTDAAVVVTLGPGGAVIVEAGHVEHVPAPGVEAIDPTGAGDAFCGAVARSLSRGDSLHAAVRLAVAAGALATTRRGAQGAMPTEEELERISSG